MVVTTASLDLEEYARKVDDWQSQEAWRRDARQMVDKMHLLPGHRVLDFGCHSGEMLRMIQEHGCEVYGVELNTVSRARARERGLKVEATFRALLERLPGSYKSKFDRIVLADVLGHLEDPERTCATLLRYLATDGLVVASAPNRWHDLLMAPLNLLSGYEADPTIRHHVGAGRLADMMEPLLPVGLPFRLGSPLPWLPAGICPGPAWSRYGWVFEKTL